MELEVVSHHGIPETSVISIRAGGTRRQSQLSSLDRAVKFPCRPEECASVKIDVLDLAGTARLSISPDTQEYTVPLESPFEGEDYTGMEVTFRLKSASGAAPDAQVTKAKDEQKEHLCRDYLEKHGLTSFLQFLLQSLMKDQPADPYTFLQRQITKKVMVNGPKSEHKAVPEDAELHELLSKLSPEGGMEVTREQLIELEQKASAAGEQLREDNLQLRETTSKLRERYDELVAGEKLFKGDISWPVSPDASLEGTTFQQLATMQDEVMGLAKENAMLVKELARMRESIDEFRSQIRS